MRELDELRQLTAGRLLAIWRESGEAAEEPGERALLCNARVLAESCFLEGKAVFRNGEDVLEALTPREMELLLRQLPQRAVVLNGVGFSPEQTGVAVREKEAQTYYFHRKQPGNYHGTGDMFAACFTGAFLRGKSVREAAGIAADMTALCVRNTCQSPAHWYGIRFESVLPELIRRLGEK